MSKTLAALLIFLFSAFYTSMAAADESEDYFQITCKPESNYFSLRTLTLPVPDCKTYKNCKIKDSTTRNSYLLELHQLITAPYNCKLQNNRLTVEIINFRPAKGSGMCGGIDHYDMRIRINDKIMREFHAYGYNRCEKGETHLIEYIEDSGQLRDCTLPDDPHSAPACHVEKISAVAAPQEPLSNH